jgi:aspartate ammonia-lyase
VYDLVLESDLVTREQLDAILSPERMLCPGEDKALIKEIAERLEKLGK